MLGYAIEAFSVGTTSALHLSAVSVVQVTLLLCQAIPVYWWT